MFRLNYHCTVIFNTVHASRVATLFIKGECGCLVREFVLFAILIALNFEISFKTIFQRAKKVSRDFSEKLCYTLENYIKIN